MRLIAYVDGFNLYFGMHSRFGREYLWLNLHQLVQSYAQPSQDLEIVRYFTAPVRGEPAAHQRQHAYLRALEAIGGVSVHKARFIEKPMRCRSCRAEWTRYEEKQTDVHLSVGLVEDAANRAMEVAMIVSGDSDMVPAVAAAKRLHPTLRVIVLSPPGRESKALIAESDGSLHISRTRLASAQLPDPVRPVKGRPIARPTHWM